MNRLTLLSAPIVLACLTISPFARSSPTTQPSLEDENRQLKEELSRTKASLLESQKAVQLLQRQLATRAPMLIPPGPLNTPRSLPLRIDPPLLNAPAQTPRQGWIQRNTNSNTWHYIVPVDSHIGN